MRIDRTVLRETRFIAAVTLACCVLMHAGFLIAGKWSLSVLWGSLLGAAAAVGNFFLMGLTIQKALDRYEQGARALSKLSWTLRMLMLAAVGAIGLSVPVFHGLATILPFFFPRIAVAIRQFVTREKAPGNRGEE